ncbi:MAG TPA: hypothetical protein VD790_03080 [Thermoleophilaceae bacterium]|nr:hypothetical protein [Thermoleophilaceae bacterium]
MGDERRPPPALELRRQPGGDREDVRHDHLGIDLLDQRLRLARRPYRRLIRLEGPLARGEDLVLGRRLEAHAERLDVRAPLGPGLEADGVPASGELGAERDRGERVPRVAERGE